MPPVPQVAQGMSQKQSDQENGPSSAGFPCSSPSPHPPVGYGDRGGIQVPAHQHQQEWTDPNNFNVCVASCKQFFKDYEAFLEVQWEYLVLDERQNGNNMTEEHWDAISNLWSRRHLLLVDTLLPMALQDLCAIACFLAPGTSRARRGFGKAAAVKQNKDHYQIAATRLHRAVRTFKIHMEQQLLRKYEHVLTCARSDQKSMRKDMLSQPRLFTPVQYGQKPEGWSRDFSRSQLAQTVDTAAVTADHHQKTHLTAPCHVCRKLA